MALLVGNATTTYSIVNNLGGGGQATGMPFTAAASGTVDTLLFRTSATANTGVTALQLGVYGDTAGSPGTRLGSGSVPGTPPVNSWITLSGLSIPVTAGVTYWLAALAIGATIFWDDAVASGGTVGKYTTSTSLASLPTPFGAIGGTWAGGPWGFQATGALAGATRIPDLAMAPPHR